MMSNPNTAGEQMRGELALFPKLEDLHLAGW